MPPYDYVGTLTQAGRLLAIETPIGPDVFLLEGMDGEEEVCALFSFRLRVRSKRQDVAPELVQLRGVAGRVEAVDLAASLARVGRLVGLGLKTPPPKSGGFLRLAEPSQEC